MSITAFLKFGNGILPLDGDSFAKGRDGWFDVFDIDYSIQKLQLPGGGAQSFLSPLSLDVSRVDGTRPNLIEVIENGLTYSDATIEVVTGDTNPFVVQRYTLSNVQVTGFEERLTTNSGLSLTFSDLTLEAFGKNPDGKVISSRLDYQGADIEEDFTFFTDPLGAPGEPSATDRETLAFLDLTKGRTDPLDAIIGNSQDIRAEGAFDVNDYRFAFQAAPTAEGVLPTLDPLTYDLNPNDVALTEIVRDGLQLVEINGLKLDVYADFQGNEVAHQKKESEDAIAPTGFVRDDDHATRVSFAPLSDIAFTATEVDPTGTKFQDTVHDLDFTGPTRIQLPPGFNGEVGAETGETGTAYLKISGIDGSESGIAGVQDKSFLLSGFGYGFGFDPALGAASGGLPTFLPVTVDFDSLPARWGDLQMALFDDSQFADVELVRVDDAGNVREKVTLFDANLASLLLDSTYDPRATFGYEAIRIETIPLAKAEEPDAVVTEWSFAANKASTETFAETALVPAFTAFGGIGPREVRGDDDAQRDYFLTFNESNQFRKRLEGETKDEVLEKVKAFDVESFRFDMARVQDGEFSTDLLLPALVVELAPVSKSGHLFLENLTKGGRFDDVVFTARDGGSKVMEKTLETVRLTEVTARPDGLTELHLLYGSDPLKASVLSTFFGFDENENSVEVSNSALGHDGRSDVSLVGGRAADALGDGVIGSGPFDYFMRVGSDPAAFQGSAIAAGYENQIAVSGVTLTSERSFTASGQLGPQEQQSLTVDILPGQLAELDLMNAVATGAVLPEVTLTRVQNDTGERSVIVLTDAQVAAIEAGNADVTRLGFEYQNIAWTDFALTSGAIQKEGTWDYKVATEEDEAPNVSVNTTGPVAEGFGSLAFLDLTEVGVTGDALTKGYEGQFDVLDWDLDLSSAIAGAAFPGDPNGVRRVDLAPLEVTVSALTPGITDLLERTREGEVLQGAKLNVATQPLGTSPQTFDIYDFSNVTVLAARQFGEFVELELGYSILNRQLRTPDEATGKFNDFQGTIDFRTDDRVQGDSSNNTLVGGFGNDSLFGDDGDDVVDGGPNDDVINAGSGAGDDSYEGGDGEDLITFHSTSQGIVVNLQTGRAFGPEIDSDTLSGIENVEAGSGNDTLTGDEGPNMLNGLVGQDSIVGLAGNDTLIGGLGHDVLDGGPGDDTMTGGAGHDVFIKRPGESDDTITDFETGLGEDDGDKIDVSAFGLDFDQIGFEAESEGLRVRLGSDSILLQGVGASALAPSDFIGLLDGVFAETGRFSLTHVAQTVTLERSYENPVAIAFVATENGGQPVNVRISDVSGNDLTLRLQEPNHLDGGHKDETVNYLVVEAGTWILPDGTLLEAGTLQSDKLSSQGFERVAFDAAFDAAPVILSQVQTFNGADFVTTRQHDASADGFQLTMQEEEALNGGGHKNETLGWVALEAGGGTAGDVGWLAGRAGAVTDDNTTVRLDTQVDGGANVIAALSSFAGPDPAWARGNGSSSATFDVSVEEDTSADAETNHAKETVDYFAFNQAGLVSAYDYDFFG